MNETKVHWEESENAPPNRPERFVVITLCQSQMVCRYLFVLIFNQTMREKVTSILYAKYSDK